MDIPAVGVAISGSFRIAPVAFAGVFFLLIFIFFFLGGKWGK
jgi:hypothetical protein